MFSKILSKARTRAEVYHLLDEIDLLLASLYENGNRGFESTMSSGIRFWVSQIISEDLSCAKEPPEKYLNSLKSFLENLENVNLTVGFEPSGGALDKFSSYLRIATGKDLVINLTIDKSILGGVVISYNGVYKDFSVIRLIGESKSEIEEIIRQKTYTAS